MADWKNVHLAEQDSEIATLRARVAEVEGELADRRQWKDEEDREDEHTPSIDAAHPCETGDHATYKTALEMVGNRFSKYALVDLVNWLLSRATRAEARVSELEAQLADTTLSSELKLSTANAIANLTATFDSSELAAAQARIRELETELRALRVNAALDHTVGG